MGLDTDDGLGGTQQQQQIIEFVQADFLYILLAKQTGNSTQSMTLAVSYIEYVTVHANPVKNSALLT